jgi:hypothetical protein
MHREYFVKNKRQNYEIEDVLWRIKAEIMQRVSQQKFSECICLMNM